MLPYKLEKNENERGNVEKEMNGKIKRNCSCERVIVIRRRQKMRREKKEEYDDNDNFNKKE